MTAPEALARERIDAALTQAGWIVQNRRDMNLHAGQGVAVREFPLASGPVDYLLFVDRRAVGVLEAKKVGTPLTDVEAQARRYAKALPASLDAPVTPLPFQYLSTGEDTRFVNGLDPEPRSRRISGVPHLHRPETLAEWLAEPTLADWLADLEAQGIEGPTTDEASRPSTFRARVRAMPLLLTAPLRPNQIEGIERLEASLFQDRRRALVQMATGSGKTYFAITQIYRLIRFAGARRVLFLVDRDNLSRQAFTEFEGFGNPYDGKKFTEDYLVNRLQTNKIAASDRVVITTIQRLYSMLKGEEDLPPGAEDLSAFEAADPLNPEPQEVVYSEVYPPEFFDVIVVDECHRSIYTLWRQVLEYFDAHLIGLTATPSSQTYGFFNKNVVMEYDHARAVADRVNVDFEIYQIKTKIGEQGATVEASPEIQLGKRDLATRQVRWEKPDEDLTYTAAQLDRDVVALDQIRTVIRTYRDRLLVDIFPGRTEVPKTLIFAKSDSHAEDIVRIVREEFGKGNAFATKITYRASDGDPKTLINDFINAYSPRIAVTVDMIATGTDTKPVEVVMFMRTVRSRLLFEQMKGRGVRVIEPSKLRSVTPDAKAKTHFVLVDCVGVTETDMADSQPLERQRSVSTASLLEHVAAGGTDPDHVSSLAARLSRLSLALEPPAARHLTDLGGTDLITLTANMVAALDPDHVTTHARALEGLAPDAEPQPEHLERASRSLIAEAVKPLAANPPFRQALLDAKRATEQTLDDTTVDEVTFAGPGVSPEDKARHLVASFREFLDENRAEIDALEFFYAERYAKRLTYDDIRQLADAIQAPPRSWTPEQLWSAFETLEHSKVKSGGAKRLLTDVVSLIRFALDQDEELTPYDEQVRDRFASWLAAQRNGGREFTLDQLRWLEMMRDHIATSVEVTIDDFELAPFAGEGGLGRAAQLFGDDLRILLDDLNAELVA